MVEWAKNNGTAFFFEKTNTILSELPIAEANKEILYKYLFVFRITAHNRYFKYAHDPFDLNLELVRLNKSDVFISGDDVVITFTYNYKP